MKTKKEHCVMCGKAAEKPKETNLCNECFSVIIELKKK
jgi:predicted nucleic acid-binding Zn ribbon protein